MSQFDERLRPLLAPGESQVRTQVSPSGAQEAPSGAQWAPSGAQEAPSGAQWAPSDAEWAPSGAQEAAEAPGEEEEAAPEEPDLGRARSLLTELRPAGFGEILVTEAWLPPAPPEDGEDREEQADPHGLWERRQELRELGLLRERPLVSFDARLEQYWQQVSEARGEAAGAIVDPYTDLASVFADVDPDLIPEYRSEAREYGRAAHALWELGRAYVVIGRVKSARGVMQAAAKADARHSALWRDLGIAHLFSRANREAAQAFEKALDAFPGDYRSGLGLAAARYHRRDFAAAEEDFRRLASSQAMGATARSMLACSLRLQQRWEEARAELGLLAGSVSENWQAMARQCLDCVDRGQQKKEGALRRRRRGRQMLKSLAAVGASAIWIAYVFASDLLHKEGRWAVLPLLLLVMLLARALRGISGGELPGEFGNSEQGLPCWQATTWVRPRRGEL